MPAADSEGPVPTNGAPPTAPTASALAAWQGWCDRLNRVNRPPRGPSAMASGTVDERAWQMARLMSSATGLQCSVSPAAESAGAANAECAQDVQDVQGVMLHLRISLPRHALPPIDEAPNLAGWLPLASI